jgi:hypothetical protein
MSMIELVGGLGLVVNNAWSPLPAAVITLLGWLVRLTTVPSHTIFLTLPRLHEHPIVGARPAGVFRPANTQLLDALPLPLT